MLMPMVAMTIVVGVVFAFSERNRQIQQIWDQLDSISKAAFELYKTQIPNWKDIDQPEDIDQADLRYIQTMARTARVDICLYIGRNCVASTVPREDAAKTGGASAGDEAYRNSDLAKNAELIPQLPEDVVKDVLYNGISSRDTRQKVNGHYYYMSYIPICNELNRGIGAIGVGRSAQSIDLSLWKYIGRSFFMSLIFMILFGLLVVRYSDRLTSDINAISKYMSFLTKADFSHPLPEKVLKRNDEVGELGEYSKKMGIALDNLIRNDQLTGILNRRAGQNQLSRLIAQANTEETRERPLCVGMADIDFFKKVNDTYGHATGDEVLKKATRIMQKYLGDVGFVCRWGGEEFLMAANLPKNEMYDLMQKMCEELRETEFTSDSRNFHVTMTMGCTQYHSPDRLETCVEIADRMLYNGKQNGRNQIVVAN